MILARIAAVLIFIALLWMSQAHPRDLDGRFANSPLKDWFGRLSSKKGNCCSDADGRVLADVDWATKDGHYLVYIMGEWREVPEEAVITEPNLSGKTMVWPVYYSPLGGPMRIEIRCFLPGSMS